MILTLLAITATAIKINSPPVVAPVEDFSYENELDYLLMTREEEVCGNEFLVDESMLLMEMSELNIEEPQK